MVLPGVDSSISETAALQSVRGQVHMLLPVYKAATVPFRKSGSQCMVLGYGSRSVPKQKPSEIIYGGAAEVQAPPFPAFQAWSISNCRS
jgi:hypothetical protein